MEKVSIKPTSKVVKATTDEEKWRNSSIYPEIMVSSKGRIKEREYQHVVKDLEDGCFRIYSVPAKTLPVNVSASGDVTVQFYSGRKWTSENVAFLVATEFVPNEDPEHFTKVKFKDKDRNNLKASNLYWDGTGVYSKASGVYSKA